MTAAYTAGIVDHYPSGDGNKRIEFVVVILFLELNGHPLAASEEDAAQAVLSLAACTLDEERFVTFLRVNTVCDIRCEKIIRRKNTLG